LFERFLHYLYTGEIGIDEITIDQMLDLMNWADFYAVHSERLSYLCAKRISDKLSTLHPLQLQNILKVLCVLL